jgi:hypothetical protein
MSKKTSIISVFTMIFAIVALLTATQVFAEPKVTQKGSYFTFQPPRTKAAPCSVYYEMNPAGNQLQKLIVNGVVWDLDDPRIRDLSDFRFCVQDDEGTIEFEGQKFSCHVPMTVTNEAGFVSNPSCPIFLNPPGIFIDPCK